MEAEAQAWSTLSAFMKKNCGVELSDTQIYLMDSRLAAGAKAHGFASTSAFALAACASGAPVKLKDAVIDAMTTHESSFFRDNGFWQAIEQHALPKLSQARPEGIRVLSTACAHGQEIYSLAMLMAEKYPTLLKKSTLCASDIAAEAMKKAQSGIFTSLEVNRGIVATRLLTHFEKAPGGFKLKDALRAHVSFKTQNLLEPLPSATKYDIIFCRNVLIYFNEADRFRVLDHLLSALAPGGFVGLGTGELYLGTPLASGLYDQPKLPKERR